MELEQKVRENILHVLVESVKAIKEKDIIKLKELSNHTIHDASTLQDEYSISVAVIIYSIAKIFERTRYQKYKEWDFFHKNVISYLENAKKALDTDNVVEFEHNIHSVLQSIDKLGKKFRKYVIEVINRAKISKASRLHEHGISAGRTAELLGINEWELMEYIGETGISDVEYNTTKSEKERLKLARGIFE